MLWKILAVSLKYELTKRLIALPAIVHDLEIRKPRQTVPDDAHFQIKYRICDHVNLKRGFIAQQIIRK